MKKLWKILPAIVLVSVLILAGCGGDGPPGGDPKGALGPTVDKTYNNVVNRGDLSPYSGTIVFTYVANQMGNSVALSGISNSEVKVNNTSLTLKLGTPSSLSTLSAILPPGVNASDSTAKAFVILGFMDGNTGSVKTLEWGKENAMVFLIYVDKDVTLTGSMTENDKGEVYTTNYNMVLKAGWNTAIQTPTAPKTAKQEDGTPDATFMWGVGTDNLTP